MFMRAFVAGSLVAGLVASALYAAETQKFGAGVSLDEVTPLARVIEGPAAYEGKTVRVEGVVTAVCAHMGCWMALAPAEGAAGKTLMLKVDDGVIVFPVTAKGRRVAAQGVVQRVGTDREGQSAAAEHANETGQHSAPASWQIKATGAVLY
jgi:hypothetical protein